VAVYSAEVSGVRQAALVLGDVVENLVRRGVEHRDPFRFARIRAQERGVHIETVWTDLDEPGAQ
jgi:hypothetical protein